MAMGIKIVKTLGGTFLVTSLLAACNESNFSSEVPARPVKKSSNAAPAEDEPFTVQPEAAVKKLPDSLAQVYAASVEKEEKFPFSLDLQNAQTQFKLVESTSSVNESRAQINRATALDKFAQGTNGRNVSDPFTQVGAKGLVDILIVIDDSGSMAEEQRELSTKMNALLSSLNGVNWQIGVITTSHTGACNMRKLIRFNQADAASEFEAAIKAGTGGDGNEQGFKQALVGLSCTFGGQSWIRADSTVAVLIVSDEDNCSNGASACANDDDNLHTFLTGTGSGRLGRTINQNAAYFGLFTPQNKAGCVGNDNIFGQNYINFVNVHSAGKVNHGNICDSSYTSTLNRISESIALLLPSQFELSQVPDAGTLTLNANPAISPSDFTLSNKTITFNKGKEPKNGTQFTATYVVGKTGLIPGNKVTLSKVPSPETVVVRFTQGNGAPTIQAAANYTVSGKDITFKTTPPELVKIDIDYRESGSLLTRFPLSNAPQGNSLRVAVNGSATSDFSYDSAANEVVLNQAPGDGASVVLSYDFVTGKILTYKLPIVAGAREIKILDGAKELAYAQSGDEFTINESDFAAGKDLVLKYDIPDGSDRIFDLPHDPIAGSESLNVSAGSCGLNNGITVANSKLVANCAVESKTDFELSYKYLELQKVYKIEGIPDPEKGSFVVSVDGEATLDFTRNGSTITLNFEPPLDSKVDIRYTFPE